MTNRQQVILMISICCLVFGTMMFFAIRHDLRFNAKINKMEQDCKELTLAFGDKVTVKEGFYAGIEGIAVGKSRMSVEIQYLKGLVLTTDSFSCGDVKAVQ